MATRGQFVLSLAGQVVGPLQAAAGGDLSAEVFRGASGDAFYTSKHLGPVRYEPFSLQIDLSMAKPVYDWIAASWGPNLIRKAGQVLALDAQGHIRQSRDFFGALITELTIPALDTSSRDAVALTVTFQPDLIAHRWAPGGGLLAPEPRPRASWLASNFRLEIDGLDCTHVNLVESFVLRREPPRDPSGDPRNAAVPLDFPDLVVTLPEASGATWIAWHEDFLVGGNNDDTREKSGRLHFLAPDMAHELGRIDLFHLGIVRLSSDTSKGDGVARLRAEMYCERMEFSAPGV